MLIKSLQVRNFRNLHHVDTTFAPGLNVIHGRNAQGKTNLMEAIYLLVTGRSFRTSNESELVPWNVDDYTGTMVRATIQKSAGQEQLAFYFDGKNKRVMVDGNPIVRLAHLVGRLNAVLFTPTDLLLVRGAPSLRRRFLDIAIGQTNRLYLEALQEYQLVLRNRNSLLKMATRGPSADQTTQLDVYDEQLSQAGARIMLTRSAALLEISKCAAEHYKAIASGAETMRLVYEPEIQLPAGISQDAAAGLIRDHLRQSRAEDLRRLSTGRGPHRDDFRFEIDNYAARQFASQGQQRSAVLAVKFAELDYLYQHTSERPLLMLDDVISELDEDRKRAFLQHLDSDIQTFITTTDAASLATHAEIQKQMQVKNGSLL
jgi:DNA replication and repair protein RecF